MHFIGHNTQSYSKYFRVFAWILIFSSAGAGAVEKSATDETASPHNMAPKARIESNSEYSKSYLARFVADGLVPEAGSGKDLGKAWCVKGNTHRGGAELSFEWDKPLPVAEIVYYGRTAFFANECWKNYEVYLDGSSKVVKKGQLKMGQGPQRIALPHGQSPREVKKLRLKFTSSFGGPNPGASEIRIYSSTPPDFILGKFTALSDPLRSIPKVAKPSPVPESRELAETLKAGRLGFDRLLVIQRHSINPSHVYTYHNEGFKAGGGLYALNLASDKEEALEELVASPEGQILDLDLSSDGKEILFSWKKSAQEPYQVYVMQADGSGLRQVSEGPSYNFNACWLPDGDIAFLSTRKPAFAYCWTSPVGTLYRMDPEGRDLRRLSANYLNDFTPTVLNDGRIIYGRWEYVDRPAIPIQSLWTLSPDGTNLEVYFGNRVLSPATFIEPRAMPGSNRILCTLTAHNGPCRGAIGIIDPSLGVNAQEAIRNLTPEVNIGRVDQGSGNQIRGPYESPWPVDEEYFLVSSLGTILLRDYDGTKQTEVLAPRGGMGFYNPLPLRPRPRPPLRPSNLPQDGGDWATLIVQDIYNGLEGKVERGAIKQICVVQEIEKSQWADKKYRAFGFQFPVVSCGATYAPKKIWGYAKIHEDGSASFKVPAGKPIYFMALDAEGRALQRMRTFTHLMPGEVQSCVGCHADRNLASPRNRARPEGALRKPQDLEPPEWGVAGFSYARIVQPVLDRHCVKCHDAMDPPKGIDLSGDKTDFFNVSYEVLARQGTVAMNSETGGIPKGKQGENPYTSWIPTYNGQEENILLVEPKIWGSPASKLARVIVSGHRDKKGKPRIELEDFERRRLFTWMDLNVPYYGTSLSNHYERQGCRQMTPPDLDRVLDEVAERRCASCHPAQSEKEKHSIPRKFYVRITEPQLNSFLLAPLAKSAGGTEACGKFVFATPEDPDYQALLQTFDPIGNLLAETPRMDMPGAGNGGVTCHPAHLE